MHPFPQQWAALMPNLSYFAALPGWKLISYCISSSNGLQALNFIVVFFLTGKVVHEYYRKITK
jgi:hypothetical protein